MMSVIQQTKRLTRREQEHKLLFFSFFKHTPLNTSAKFKNVYNRCIIRKREDLKMKKDVELLYRSKIKERLNRFPEFVKDFFYFIEHSKALSSRFEYAKDLHLFFDFLLLEKIIHVEKISDIQPEHIKEITERNIREFLDYLNVYEREYERLDGTVVVQSFENKPIGKTRKLATLHSFYHYLVKKDIIQKDVTVDIEIKVSGNNSIRNKMSSKEIELFFETIWAYNKIEFNRLRDYVMVEILAYTGIRIGELVGLDLNDVWLSRGELEVTRKWGEKETVILPNKIRDDVKEYIQHRNNIKVPIGWNYQALFLSQHKKRIDPKTVRLMLDKYRKLAGIRTKITPHTFRRTFGSNHYNTYKDMYLTAKVLGHSSAETTAKHYAQPDGERVEKSRVGFSYSKEREETDIEEKVRKLAKLTGFNEELLLSEFRKK